MVKEKYMKKRASVGPKPLVVMEVQTLEKGLSRMRILNLLEIPFFGKTTTVKFFARLLLSKVKGVYLCMYKMVSIDFNLIK